QDHGGGVERLQQRPVRGLQGDRGMEADPAPGHRMQLRDGGFAVARLPQRLAVQVGDLVRTQHPASVRLRGGHRRRLAGGQARREPRGRLARRRVLLDAGRDGFERQPEPGKQFAPVGGRRGQYQAGWAHAVLTRASRTRASWWSMRRRASSMESRTWRSSPTLASPPCSRSHKRCRSISRIASCTGSPLRSPATAVISERAVRSFASRASAASSRCTISRWWRARRWRRRATQASSRPAATVISSTGRSTAAAGSGERSVGTASGRGANDFRPRARRRVTGARPVLSIPRLMSARVPNVPVPETVDAWRMVSARRGVEGRVPLERFRRLRDALEDAEGEVSFTLDFDRDELQVPYAELRIEAGLPLQCQRSLERFVLPVALVQRLGLVRSEAEEAALPEGYEALEVPPDGILV